MFANWLLNALATGCGAFSGAIGAYYLACRKEKARQKNEYLCLLLIVHEHLESLCKLLSDIPAESIREIDGRKVVSFDMPFPNLEISTEQMQTLIIHVVQHPCSVRASYFRRLSFEPISA